MRISKSSEPVETHHKYTNQKELSLQMIAFGFSQGSAVISTLSLMRPGMFRGVAILSGFVPRRVFAEDSFVNECYKENSSLLPKYFIAHGTKDEVVPILRANVAKRELEALGAQVELHTDDVGHKVSSAGIRALQAWVERLL